MPADVYIAQMFKGNSGKLEYANDSDKEMIKKVLASLKPGERVKMVIDTSKDDGRWSQIKKVHAIIDEISDASGNDFDTVKDEIKKRAGLYMPDEKLKSFADCSMEDLSRAIRSAITFAEYFGLAIK